MKPFVHAKNSVRKWGGKISDYLGIHNFMDISKSAHPDVRHRALLHNSLGCYIAERMFGYPHEKLAELSERFDWSEEERQAIIDLLDHARTDAVTYITNSDGKLVQVRDIAEHHCIEDMGRIPTVSDYLDGLPMYEWLGGKRGRLKIKLVD
jgi:hypothetical protein